MFKWLLKLVGYSRELPTVGKYYQSKKEMKDPFSKDSIVYIIDVKNNYVQYKFYLVPFKTLGAISHSTCVVQLNTVFSPIDKTVELVKS